MSRVRRHRYELRNAELNHEIEALVERAQREFGRDRGADYVRQMMVSALRLLQEGTSEGDLKLLNNALKELRHARRVFAPYEHVRKVAIFGSARTGSEHPDWRQAFSFAERMVAESWMVITGGGDGIMGAAQVGAGREASFGVNIRLPFEQRANHVIAGDGKLINFRYFFTRKITFVKQAHAIALFPGGFGTLDEGYEALTLIQTGKSEIVPVVFVDAPGGTYWKEWLGYLESHLRERALIAPEDLSLFRITDDVGTAVREVVGFYRNYHSSRYVDDELVLRVRRAPDPQQLQALNEEFADIVVKGALEIRDALPQESGEVGHLPRIAFFFDRRSVGRLRQLIDHLNRLEAAEPSARDASPREIVPLDLPPEALHAEQDDDPE